MEAYTAAKVMPKMTITDANQCCVYLSIQAKLQGSFIQQKVDQYINVIQNTDWETLILWPSDAMRILWLNILC